MWRSLFLFTVLCGCKTTQPVKTEPHGIPAATPMSCRIKGQIIEVIKSPGTDTASICYKYFCKAKVKVVQVFGCGSSVSLPLSVGDTVELEFAYTFHNTEHILPNMKAQYPGLKKGDVFTANAEQRLQMGTSGKLVVYDYTQN